MYDFIRTSKSQAHYIATLALYELADGWSGPATLRKLNRLHDDLEATNTPQEIVQTFLARGAENRRAEMESA